MQPRGGSVSPSRWPRYSGQFFDLFYYECLCREDLRHGFAPEANQKPGQKREARGPSLPAFEQASSAPTTQLPALALEVVMRRTRGRLMARAFGLWRQRMRKASEALAMLHLAAAYVVSRQLAVAYTYWMSAWRRIVRGRMLHRRAARRLLHQQLGRAWASWAAAHGFSVRLTKMGRRLRATRNSAALACAWAALRAEAERAKRRDETRRRVLQVVTRLMRGELWGTWLRWAGIHQLESDWRACVSWSRTGGTRMRQLESNCLSWARRVQTDPNGDPRSLDPRLGGSHLKPSHPPCSQGAWRRRGGRRGRWRRGRCSRGCVARWRGGVVALGGICRGQPQPRV